MQVGSEEDVGVLQQTAEARQAFLLSVTNWCHATKQPLPFLALLHNVLQSLGPERSCVPASMLHTLRLADSPIRLESDSRRCESCPLHVQADVAAAPIWTHLPARGQRMSMLECVSISPTVI